MRRRLGVCAALVVAVLLPARPGRAWALPPDFPWNLTRPVIASVELRMPRGVSVPGMKSLVPIRPGQVLTRHALRRTVRLLYETRQFRQVSAYVRPASGGVAVTFVLFPRQKIADVSFLGATAFGGDALRRISGLKRGQEFLKGAVYKAAGAIIAAYHRKGYQRVTIDPEVREGNNGLVACVFRIDEGPRTRLLGVRFEGRTGLTPGVLRAAFGFYEGAPLDLDAAEAALPRIRARYRKSGYLRATVGDPTVAKAKGVGPGPWGYLVIPVQSGPVVHFRILGNTVLSDARVRSLLKLPDDEPATLDVIQDGAARVARRYRLLGYAHVSVKVHQVRVAPEVRRVDLVITEGRRLEVANYRFPGATVFTVSRLRQQVCDAVAKATAPPPLELDPRAVADLGGHPQDAAAAPPPPQLPDPCTVYDPDEWQTALDAIRDLYRNDGYLGIEVEDPVLRPLAEDGRVEAVIRIHQGIQTRVSRVRFDGASAIAHRQLDRAIEVRAGHPLSYLKVEEGRYAIRAVYARNGYPFTKVHDRVSVDGDRRHAEVDYLVHQGPQVHVGRIIVRGHYDTPASLVRSRLQIHQGDVWNPAKVRASQQAILALGIYRSAVIRFLDADDPARVMDVVVQVSERKPEAAELGFGLSTEEGPRVYAEYTNLLFWGGSELHARAKANYPIFYAGLVAPGLEWEVHLGLKFPMLLGSRTDLVWERRYRPTYSPAYKLTRLAWSVGTEGRIARHVSGTIKAGIEFDDLSKGHTLSSSNFVLTQQDREFLRLEQGQVLLASVEPGITIDLRNDPFSPTSGWLITANLDWSKDLGIRVQPMHFLKTVGSVTRYQPLPAKLVLAVSASGGVVIPLIPDNHTIGPKRFFLGGADSLRGFPVDSVLPQDQRIPLHDQVIACERSFRNLCAPDALSVINGQRPTSAGGDAYILLRGELRFPIVGALEGGVFVDAGNLWRDPRDMSPLVLRTAAGFGIRYKTPVGPVALDLGFNLDPDTAIREDPYALHFSIGVF